MGWLREQVHAFGKHLRESVARSAVEQREAAFANSGLSGPLGALIAKVAREAYRVTDADVRAAQASGLTEDQIFELVIAAAVGEATRQVDAALAALDTAQGQG